MASRIHISWNSDGYRMPRLGWSPEHLDSAMSMSLLFHLHWLPISYRIKSKILLLTFKCLYGQAPNYLIDFITIKKQSRYSLRSNESIFLELPGINASVKSKLQHAPPPCIPRAFDTFAVPGRREFDYQSLPGGGEFDPHALGVGNLNWTLDFM